MKSGNAASPADALEVALLSSDRVGARKILRDSCSTDEPYQCITDLIEPALRSIGVKWADGEASLSQVYVSGRICEEFIRSLPVPSSGIRPDQPVIGIAVLEDYHTLGKETVMTALHASGYQVTDYGAGLSVSDLVEKIRDDGIEVIFISALMLRAALKVRELTTSLKEAGLSVRVIVGGAPFLFDEHLWQEVDADAFAHDAGEAVSLVGGGLP